MPARIRPGTVGGRVYDSRPGTVDGRVTDSRDQLPADSTPDIELMHLTRAEIERSGGRLSYSQANLVVLRRDVELAERYRHMPGVKDQ